MAETPPEQQLEAIRERLAGVEQPPATTLQILGEGERERYWEDLLVYFLDASNPHGFGTDVLAAFLDALAAHESTSVEPTHADLEQVTVQSQVPTGNGPLDVLLWREDAWFVVIELKVNAAETGAQTTRYAQADTLGDLNVNHHTGESEYVYLAPKRARSPKSEAFVDVAWEDVVPHLEEVLSSSHGEYPFKSHGQLADYLDTIRRTLHMDELTTISEETKLYIEYAETINRLEEAYQNDKSAIFNRLETAFFGGLEGNREAWTVNNRPKRYINFAKESWHNVAGDVTIEYEPHVQLDSTQPEIRLRLDIEGGNKQTVRDQLNERLSERERTGLEERGWEIVNESYAYFAKPVQLDLERTAESIDRAMQELHAFRRTVEPHIGDIVAEYS